MAKEKKPVDEKAAPVSDAPKIAKPANGKAYEMGEPTMEGEYREAWLRARKAAPKKNE